MAIGMRLSRAWSEGAQQLSNAIEEFQFSCPSQKLSHSREMKLLLDDEQRELTIKPKREKCGRGVMNIR